MDIQTNADVAAKGRGVLAEKRVKQAAIAEAVHLSRMAISRRLSGDTPFAPEELITIAGVCGVTVSVFFGERAEAMVAA